ncbi:MAG: 2-dehydropantoate 2-reductase [Chloroflexota bacterium]|nr:2-dehydropantoate 2-reductase [Dehalococcoidia bacterium]MDW8253698.1 2-dehydropantoate 2-reductase [Chloroflexota bacterium]
MRYIIFGAGAVGGAIGARLADAGHTVILVCRGDHLAAIRRDGLLLRTPDRAIRVRVPAVSAPAEIDFDDDDVVFLTMKSHDTTPALEALERAAGDVPVICAQNGVANERMAARRFSRVYAMNVHLPATFFDPGVVDAYGVPVTGVLDCGRFPRGVDPLIQRVAADLASSGFLSRAVEDIMRLKYAKLLINLTNGLEAIVGEIPPGGGSVGAALRDEAAAVFRAAGIDWASEEEMRERILRHYRYGEIPGAPRRHGSSTWQSLAKGRSRLEVDYLNGEICLLGMLHGIPTPRNAAIRQLAQQMASQGKPPGASTLPELEAMLANWPHLHGPEPTDEGAMRVR